MNRIDYMQKQKKVASTFFLTIDLLRKDFSAAISRFRRRGDFAAKYASRLDYENLYAVGLIPIF